jgi:hypothetical protein
LAGIENGDFNGDVVVDGGDYLIIDRAFLAGGGVFGPGVMEGREEEFGAGYGVAMLGSVPEPGVMGMGVILILGMRKRTRDGIRG